MYKKTQNLKLRSELSIQISNDANRQNSVIISLTIIKIQDQLPESSRGEAQLTVHIINYYTDK